MDTITVKDGTQIYYKDWGTGQPLFFHHGWPLSADDWDGQMMYWGVATASSLMIAADTAAPPRQ
jgi:pimeloyl-ACP methyl ester carboxylesterase